jgi:hypothetical protein
VLDSVKEYLKSSFFMLLNFHHGRFTGPLILNDLKASANLFVSYRVALEEDRPVQREKRESDIRLLEAVGTFIGNILGPIMSAAVSSLTA